MLSPRHTIMPLLPLLLLLSPAAEASEGVLWEATPLSEVLQEKETTGSEIIVKVGADWCPSCRELDKAIFKQPIGATFFAGKRAFKVDFDQESSRTFIEKYAILGLPTVLLLRSDGSEMGRIMGFESREKWLKQARSARRQSGLVQTLEAGLTTEPADAAAVLKLGKLLLNLGRRDRAVALLEQLSWMPGAAPNQTAESLFVLGRYLHRVLRQPSTARHIWRELATRFPTSAWAGGAWWWYAKAQADIGQHVLGARALRQRFAQSDQPQHALAWAEFIRRHTLHDLAGPALSTLDGLSKGSTDAKAIHKARQGLRQLLDSIPGH